MNRKDYRKMMQNKRRNANYAKMTVLASLGLGVALANSTTVKAESREWTPNTSTTIKQGDKQYTIKWGDYLALISKDSGLTIETLMKLNDSIVNADLIYEGNIIYFGDGVNAVVKDSKGNTIASTPLTEADKVGIKQADAQKVNRASKTEDKKKNNNSKVNVVNNGNGTGTVTKPNPTKPVKPTTPTTKPDEGKPKPSVKPDAQEVSMKVYYLQVASVDDLENAVILKEETVKAKKGEKVTVKAKEFENMNLISEPSITVTAEKDAEIIFDYVHKDAREVTVRSITEDGQILDEFIETDFDILVGEEVSYIAGEFEGYELVSDEEQTIIIDTDNAKNIIEFVYREKTTDPTKPVEDKMLATRTYFDVDTEDYIFTDTLEVTLKDGKAIVKADTIPQGYKLVDGETGVREVSRPQSTASFRVEKIKDVTPPIKQEFTITINHVVEATGEILSTETRKGVEGTTVNAQALNFEDRGYVLVGEETQSIVVTSNETITFYYKEVDNGYIPVHTEETVYVDVDTEGNTLTSTEGYTYFYETSDGGVVTTSENGDTHTVYTITRVWKARENSKVEPSDFGGKYTSDSELIIGESEGTLYDGVGNLGATFPTQRDASLYALNKIAETGEGGSYLVWQVKFKDGTIAYTSHLV